MRRVIPFAVSVVLIFFARDAPAADAGYCSVYSNAAVSAELINQRGHAPGNHNPQVIPDVVNDAFACGFFGPQWTRDFNAHYQWCLGADPSQADAETAARESDLEQCGSCREYVTAELGKVADARRQHCRLSSAAARSDVENRFQWCMSQAQVLDATNTDLAAVQNQIDACQAARLRQRLSVRRPDYQRIIKTPAGAVR